MSGVCAGKHLLKFYVLWHSIYTTVTAMHKAIHKLPFNEVSSNTHAKYPSICQTSWEGFTTHTPRTMLLVLAVIYFS